MRDAIRTIRGITRSLRIYYGDPRHSSALDAMYGQFISVGALAFDIGAHVGDRVASFRRLGAHVVAVEPQPALVTTLRMLYGRDRGIVIEPLAVGRQTGWVELNINLENPTVSTASPNFIAAANGALGWRDQIWSKRIRVPMTTIDALIAKHGVPSFIKIDVEGFEEEVLAGLGCCVPALSFEFTVLQRAVALRCIERCRVLGYSQFNVALGESQRLQHGKWMDANEVTRWIDAVSAQVNSGDIYARLNGD